MPNNASPAIREATGAYIRSLLDAFLPPIREAARARGYAVAVHGSLKRDIDLIAVPWTNEACSPREVAESIRAAVADVTGACSFLGEVGEKPHRRYAYTLVHSGFAGEIDLSVIGPAWRVDKEQDDG